DFEEGETAATPPPSTYCVTTRISIRPHIPMPFPSKSEKKARFTSPTGEYEVGKSSVVAATRQIRPALTVDDSHRAEDRLIGRLRRERRYFRTLSTTYAQERVTKALAKYETQRNSVVNGDTRHTTGTGLRTIRPTRECTYKDYLNYGPLKFKGAEGVIGLTQWFERTESNSYMRAVGKEVAYAMPWKTLKQMMTVKYFPRGEVKKLEVELWNLKVKGTDITSYTLRF
nr:hypothetical protein [Tanacetum cinerariifolium]